MNPTNLSIFGLCEEVIQLGLKEKKNQGPRNPRVAYSWTDDFDIKAWDGLKPEFLPEESSTFANGSKQETVVRVLAGMQNPLGGYDKMVLGKITATRSLPAGKQQEPKPEERLETCPWTVFSISYYKSPGNKNKIENIET